MIKGTALSLSRRDSGSEIGIVVYVNDELEEFKVKCSSSRPLIPFDFSFNNLSKVNSIRQYRINHKERMYAI